MAEAQPPRVLLCVGRTTEARVIEHAARMLPAGSTWVLLHVVDARARLDVGLLRAGVPGAGPLPWSQRQDILEAEQEHARSVLDRAAALLEPNQSGPVERRVRLGEPGREICAAAMEERVDIVVLGANQHPRGALRGPASVGPTARFVVDHAPCPVLLYRPGP